MNSLGNMFRYGLIGRNYYASMDKTIISSYKMLKNFPLDEITDELHGQNSLSKINIPRCVAVALYINKKEFPSLFMKEIEDIKQLMIFWKTLIIIDIPINKAVSTVISDWLIRNLQEEISINYKAFLYEVMTRIHFKAEKKMGARVIINTQYILYNEDYLPKRRVILKLKTDFLKGLFKAKEHIELIRDYKIGISDIRRYLYELLDTEKEKIITECIPNSTVNDLVLLTEVFPEGIPEAVQEAGAKRLCPNNFHDIRRVRDILPVKLSSNSERFISKNTKIFIDTSYSMKHNLDGGGLFMEYLSHAGVDCIQKFFVAEEVVEFDNYPLNLVSLSKRCDCIKILYTMKEKDTVLFITDGHTDIYNLVKEFRTRFVNSRLVVWFINSKNDHPSKFKNIYYFYGEAEKLVEVIQDFITKE